MRYNIIDCPVQCTSKAYAFWQHLNTDLHDWNETKSTFRWTESGTETPQRVSSYNRTLWISNTGCYLLWAMIAAGTAFSLFSVLLTLTSSTLSPSLHVEYLTSAPSTDFRVWSSTRGCSEISSVVGQGSEAHTKILHVSVDSSSVSTSFSGVDKICTLMSSGRVLTINVVSEVFEVGVALKLWISAIVLNVCTGSHCTMGKLTGTSRSHVTYDDALKINQ